MSTSQSMTLKDRVTEFWKWFPTVAERYYLALEAGKFDEHLEEFSNKMSELLYGMAWVFGPGCSVKTELCAELETLCCKEDTNASKPECCKNSSDASAAPGYSLTVSGEGVAAKQLIAKFWLESAISLPGWSFYSSRQPTDLSSLAEMSIAVGQEKSVDTVNFLFEVFVNEETQKFDLTAWHESLSAVPPEHHHQILFLLLDEALGEFGTSMWIGEIAIRPIQPSDATINLVQLRRHIVQIAMEHGWKRLPPLEEFAVYQLPEQADFPRGDTIVGVSCIPGVIFELLENSGTLEDDPVEGTGAELVYIQLDSDVFPEGAQSQKRAEIEDYLESHLVAHRSGYTLGGAFGEQFGYIDLILFDGDHSRDLVKKALRDLHLADRARLVSFC